MFQFSSSKKIFLKFSKRNTKRKKKFNQATTISAVQISSWNDFLQIFQHSDFSTWFDPRFRVWHRAYMWTLSRDAFYGNLPSSHPDYVFIQLESSRYGGVRAEKLHRGVKKMEEKKKGGRKKEADGYVAKLGGIPSFLKKTKRRLLKKKRNDSGPRWFVSCTHVHAAPALRDVDD